ELLDGVHLHFVVLRLLALGGAAAEGRLLPRREAGDGERELLPDALVAHLEGGLLRLARSFRDLDGDAVTAAGGTLDGVPGADALAQLLHLALDLLLGGLDRHVGELDVLVAIAEV